MKSSPQLIGKHAFLVDPRKLQGFCLTGVPKKTEYKDLILPLKEALSELDYVFASIIQVHKIGAIENGFPTLAIAFDELKVNTQQRYEGFLDALIIQLLPVLEKSNVQINLAVLDRREPFLGYFREPSSWMIEIKDRVVFDKKVKPWWRFW